LALQRGAVEGKCLN